MTRSRRVLLIPLALLAVVVVRASSPPTCIPIEPESFLCAADADCTVCTFGTAPASTADCYCPLCPHEAMTAEECDHNVQAWERHCSPHVWPEGYPCPIPMCVQPPPVRCSPWGGFCEADEDGYTPF